MISSRLMRRVAFGGLLIAVVAGCGLSDKSGVEAYNNGDYATATIKFKKSGSAKANCYLGLMALKGEGRPQNIPEAVSLLQKSAEGGYADAQFNVATMYARGLGLPLNKQEALKWYQKAAEQGNSLAEFNLGLMYLTGDGVRADRNAALTWIRKAADHDNPRAKQALQSLGK